MSFLLTNDLRVQKINEYTSNLPPNLQTLNARQGLVPFEACSYFCKVLVFQDRHGRQCRIWEFDAKGEGTLDRLEVAKRALKKVPIIENICGYVGITFEILSGDGMEIGPALGTAWAHIERDPHDDTKEKNVLLYFLLIKKLTKLMEQHQAKCRQNYFGRAVHLVDDLHLNAYAIFQTGELISPRQNACVTMYFMEYLGKSIGMSTKDNHSSWRLHCDWIQSYRIIAVLKAILLLPWKISSYESMVQILDSLFQPVIMKSRTLYDKMRHNATVDQAAEYLAYLQGLQAIKDVGREAESEGW